MVNMPACQAGDRGFKSRQLRQHATVAQLVEQRTENPRVAGSIPARGTTKFHYNTIINVNRAEVAQW